MSMTITSSGREANGPAPEPAPNRLDHRDRHLAIAEEDFAFPPHVITDADEGAAVLNGSRREFESNRQGARTHEPVPVLPSGRVPLLARIAR